MSASGYRDIYSGVLHKCGGRIKSWTKRWMVLRSDYCLYYYKDATKNHLGVISLRDTQFKIRVGQRSDASWPKNLALENTFAVVTTPRVYYMFAETKAEAEEWRKVLEETHQDLVEVARTKSFSGRRSNTVSEQQTSPLSQSVNVRSETQSVVNGARPKAYTCTRDSITSTASSAFGRQFTLSSSSDIDGSMLQLEEVESVYNVLQHPSPSPLVQGVRAGETVVGGDGREGDTGLTADADGEPHYTPLPRRTYTAEEGQRLGSVCSADYDYVLPPDALESCPQNISVTIQESDQVARTEWVGPDKKGVELTEQQPTSETSLESFYDVAREVEDAAVQQPQQMGGAVYEEVKGEDKAPPTKNGNQSKKVFSRTPPKMSALRQPLPSIPPSFTETPPPSSNDTKEEVLIYEDVPDMPHPPLPKEEVLYEPVDTREKKEDDIYSEVGYEEKSGRVEGGGKYFNGPSGGEEESGVERGVSDPSGDGGGEESGGETVVKYVNVPPGGGERELESGGDTVVSVPSGDGGGEESGGETVVKYVNVPPGGGERELESGGDTVVSDPSGDGGGEESGGETSVKYVNVPPGGGERELESGVERGVSVPSGDDGGEESGGETVVKYVNVPSGSSPPSFPGKDPSPPPPPLPPPPTSRDVTSVTKPTPAPRHTKPNNPNIKTDQLPSNRSDESLSNGILNDQLQSNSDHSEHTPGPRTNPIPSGETAHTPPHHVPSPPKTRSLSDAPSPSPSIQPFHRRFSPPPSPRSKNPPRPPSPRSPRPPSPLLSDRRVSGASDIAPHLSNESSPETVHRQRAPSLKEKGMALFQRRQQEVTSLSEADSQRRKRSLSMLKGLQSDLALSPDDKVLFAETLREVETERMKASEEKFRWERERLQLEEERKQLERERLRLQEELQRTRNEILQS